MERMNLDPDEIEEASGEKDRGLTCGETHKKMGNSVRAAWQWKCTIRIR